MAEVLRFMGDPRILIPLIVAELIIYILIWLEYSMNHQNSFERKLVLKIKDLWRAILRKTIHHKKIGE